MENKIITTSEKNTGSSRQFRLIVIGASAGGLNALTELVAQLPPDGHLAVFIVLHLSKKGLGSFLVHRLQGNTTYKCRLAQGDEPIETQTIYIAPPDCHLLVKADGHVLIGNGPTENRWRPCIDVLFRSAAVAYGPLVTGIILTGMMNDGVSGMLAIRKSGGTTIVQDPNEAEYPDMPMAVLDNLEVDYCLPLREMGHVLTTIDQAPFPEPVVIPQELLAEAQIAENVAVGIEYPRSIGEKSLFTCPDCGGEVVDIDEATAAGSGKLPKTNFTVIAATWAIPTRSRTWRKSRKKPWKRPCGSPCA